MVGCGGIAVVVDRQKRTRIRALSEHSSSQFNICFDSQAIAVAGDRGLCCKHMLAVIVASEDDCAVQLYEFDPSRRWDGVDSVAQK